MDPDDLEPRKKPAEKKNLDIMSIEALNDYIAELEAEIARAREAIAHKESARNAADAVFK
jgi:uncharacterized small protein (DUF1192 family)